MHSLFIIFVPPVFRIRHHFLIVNKISIAQRYTSNFNSHHLCIEGKYYGRQAATLLNRSRPNSFRFTTPFWFYVYFISTFSPPQSNPHFLMLSIYSIWFTLSINFQPPRGIYTSLDHARYFFYIAFKVSVAFLVPCPNPTCLSTGDYSARASICFVIIFNKIVAAGKIRQSVPKS